MTTAAELARAVEAALTQVLAAPGIREAEVFAAENGGLLTRLSYTSHIPCNGVEEPKSTESRGIGIQAVFESPDGPLVGFGSEPSDLGPSGVGRALERARRAAVRDPNFVSLPKSSDDRPAVTRYHDESLMRLDDAQLVELGWKVVNGALRTFLASSRLAALAGSEEALARLGLIVGGDVTVLQERIAIASSGISGARTDESTLITAFVTAMVEARDGKGSGDAGRSEIARLATEAEHETAGALEHGLDPDPSRLRRLRLLDPVTRDVRGVGKACGEPAVLGGENLRFSNARSGEHLSERRLHRASELRGRRHILPSTG